MKNLSEIPETMSLEELMEVKGGANADDKDIVCSGSASAVTCSGGNSGVTSPTQPNQ